MNDHCNLEFSEFGIALGKMQCDDKTTIDDLNVSVQRWWVFTFNKHLSLVRWCCH